MKQLLKIVIGLLCISACTQQKGTSRMDAKRAKRIVQDVSQRNLAYMPLTEKDDTMMQQVVAFYQKHGTSNELMEAYYLQGSVYRDLKDAPKAMKAFLCGISVADTSREDCRYDILVRLHGQKTEILRKQKLHKQADAEHNIIATLAIKAKDTLFAIDSQWESLSICYRAGEYETCANECWPLLEKCKEWGYYTYAAGQLTVSILAHLKLGRVDEAQQLMTIYEQKSGDVDIKTMESTFPIYYYAKGRLLLARHQADSAEWFFRREMREQDWNNRQAAYRGMREVFEQTGQRDSALKYAILQCEAVDSDYQEKVTSNLQNLQQLYDYTRTQEDMHRKELLLQREQRKALYLRWAFAFTILVIVFFVYYLHTLHQQKISEAELDLERANSNLAEREEEAERLRMELERMENDKRRKELTLEVIEAESKAKEMEQTVLEKQKILDGLRQKALLKSKELRQRNHNVPVFEHLRRLAEAGSVAKKEEYEQVLNVLLERDATLMQRFNSIVPTLTDMELKNVLLLRIGLNKTETAILTAHTKSAVSNTINRLFEKANNRKPHNSGESYEWVIGL